MTKVNWLLESDIYGDDIKPIVKEIQKQGHGLAVLSNKEYWDTHWSHIFDPKECVIYYGGLNMGYCIRKDTEWIPGIYSTLENYKCSNYYPAFTGLLLNENYMLMPYGDLLYHKAFIYESLGIDNAIFIRPNSGNKIFTGQLIYEERFEHDVKRLGFVDIAPEELCVIAEPHNIEKEWRFLVIDDKVVAGSLYSSLKLSLTNNKDDIAAQEMAIKAVEQSGYRPDRAWVIDICKTKFFGTFVLEIGCFSCAGLYTIDSEIIVKEISRIAREDWEELYG